MTYRRSTVWALAIQDWTFEHVAEFLLCAQEVWPHKIHHTPILEKIVLQGVSSHDHTPSEDVKNKTFICFMQTLTLLAIWSPMWATHLVLIFLSACDILACGFFMRCPSSQITTSGPGLHRALWIPLRGNRTILSSSSQWKNLSRKMFGKLLYPILQCLHVLPVRETIFEDKILASFYNLENLARFCKGAICALGENSLARFLLTKQYSSSMVSSICYSSERFLATTALPIRSSICCSSSSRSTTSGSFPAAPDFFFLNDERFLLVARLGVARAKRRYSS